MMRGPLLLFLAALLYSCGDAPARENVIGSPRAVRHTNTDSLASVPTSSNADTKSAADSSSALPTILFIGTSLTAGYGIDISQAYPAVVESMLDSAGHPAHVINAGVSGETSAGAVRRIDWVLRTPADVIVVETGANDGLRGLDLTSLRSNIETLLARIRARQPRARVFLVQMEAPPNMGARYTKAFHDLFPEAARASGVELMPFLLAGVAGDPALNQDDGIHPNVRGAQIVGANVTRALLRRRDR